MFTKKLFLVLLCGFALFTTSLHAGEDEQVARLLQTPAGVFDV